VAVGAAEEKNIDVVSKKEVAIVAGMSYQGGFKLPKEFFC